jgi:predicted nucleic acid-binding protein
VFPRASRTLLRFWSDVANLSAALLDLRGRGLERVGEQQVFIVRVCDACERPHFRVRQASVGERGRDRGQRAQCLRRAHLLSCRGQRNAAAPREPLGTAPETPLGPPDALVAVTARSVNLAAVLFDRAVEFDDNAVINLAA